MNTNMTEFRWVSKVCLLVLWTNIASALKGLSFRLRCPHIRGLFALDLDNIGPRNSVHMCSGL